MKTRKRILAEGFTIDNTCYPPLAYKGPRFEPTEAFEILTELEEELLEATNLVLGCTIPTGNASISEGKYSGMFRIPGNRLETLADVKSKTEKHIRRFIKDA